MMLLPRKQFRNASMSFGFRGPRGAMVVPCNEGGASHLTILRPHHILWKARGASIISLPDAQQFLRPHHFFTTDHASPQLHFTASDTVTAAGSGSDDDGDDGMLPCMYNTYGMHGHLRHAWA